MENTNRILQDQSIITFLAYQLGGDTDPKNPQNQLQQFQEILANIQINQDSIPTLQSYTEQVFPSKIWDELYVRCKLIPQNQYSINTWPEFQVSEKVHGVIGILYMQAQDSSNKNDPQQFQAQIQEFKKYLQDNRLPLSKLIIVNNIEEEQNNEILQEIEKELEQNQILHIKSIEQNIDQITQTFNEIITNLIQSFCNEVSDIQKDQGIHIFFNQQEDKIKDPKKVQQRKQARQLKYMGDLSNLILSYQDAIFFYQQAYDLLKKNEDSLWLAGCLEGICCAYLIKYLYLHRKQLENNNNENIEQNYNEYKKVIFKHLELELFPKMNEAIQEYNKGKFHHFIMQAYFKYMRALVEMNGKYQFNNIANDFFSYIHKVKVIYKELSLVDVQVQYYSIIADMYQQLDMKRKYSLYIYKVAMLYIESNQNLCCELLTKISENFKLYPFEQDFDTKTIDPYWPELQANFLTNLIKATYFPKKKISIFLNMIQSFFHVLEQKNQKEIMDELKNLSKVNKDQILPANLSYLPLLYKVQTVPSNETYKKNDRIQQEKTQEKKLFIFEPWKKSVQKLQYACQEEITFKIYLLNVLEIPFDIHVYLKCEGIDYQGNWEYTYLRCKNDPIIKSQVLEDDLQDNKYLTILEYKIRPLQPGNLKIIGIQTRLFNTVHLHEIDDNGYGLQYKKALKLNLEQFRFLTTNFESQSILKKPSKQYQTQDMVRHSPLRSPGSPRSPMLKKKASSKFNIHEIEILQQLADLDIDVKYQFPFKEQDFQKYILDEQQDDEDLQLDTDYILYMEQFEKLKLSLTFANHIEVPVTQLKLQICIDYIEPPIQQFEYEWEEFEQLCIEKDQVQEIIFVQDSQYQQYLLNKNQNTTNTSKQIIKVLPSLKHDFKNAVTFTFNIQYMENKETPYIKQYTLARQIQRVQGLDIKELKIYDDQDILYYNYQKNQQQKEILKQQQQFSNGIGETLYLQLELETAIEENDYLIQIFIGDNLLLYQINDTKDYISKKDEESLTDTFRLKLDISKKELYNLYLQYLEQYQKEQLQQENQQEQDDDEDTEKPNLSDINKYIKIHYQSLSNSTIGLLSVPDHRNFNIEKQLKQDIQLEFTYSIIDLESQQVQKQLQSQNAYDIQLNDSQYLNIQYTITQQNNQENINQRKCEIRLIQKDQNLIMLEGKTHFFLTQQQEEQNNNDQLQYKGDLNLYYDLQPKQELQSDILLEIIEQESNVHYYHKQIIKITQK